METAMYERIVLAYDGTKEGLIALREGALLAKRFQAEVFILSVVPDNDRVALADTLYVDFVGAQVEGYRALLDHARQVSEQLGLKPVTRLVTGEPAVQISAFAKEVRADLVVLGHQKRSLFQRWWSGSSGAYVSDLVDCSVLVGRHNISSEAFEAELIGQVELLVG
jgi:nucleotide-binding universal stress UspA family protein